MPLQWRHLRFSIQRLLSPEEDVRYLIIFLHHLSIPPPAFSAHGGGRGRPPGVPPATGTTGILPVAEAVFVLDFAFVFSRVEHVERVDYSAAL